MDSFEYHRALSVEASLRDLGWKWDRKYLLPSKKTVKQYRLAADASWYFLTAEAALAFAQGWDFAAMALRRSRPAQKKRKKKS